MTVSQRLCVGVYGGTFDPVHHGHLRTALELREQLNIDRLHLVPCHQPSHRAPPMATALQRLAMLRLAVEGCEGLVVDDREIRRGGVSYSIDTLREMRGEVALDAALGLIVGADAFLALPSWKEWRQLADLAHLIVMRRPGADVSLSGELKSWAEPRMATAAALRERSAGAVILLEQTQLAISSSHIRALCAAGASPRFLLPDRVLDYLNTHHLYVAPENRH
jgi:nicotinate-nucleotide adenylyltransferase